MSYEPRPERPRVEPEIFPPGAPPPRRGGAGPRIFVAAAGPRGGRFGVRTPGPLMIAAVLLGFGLFLGLVLFVVLGAMLIALPVLAILLSATFAAAVLRGWLTRRSGRRPVVLRRR